MFYTGTALCSCEFTILAEKLEGKPWKRKSKIEARGEKSQEDADRRRDRNIMLLWDLACRYVAGENDIYKGGISSGLLQQRGSLSPLWEVTIRVDVEVFRKWFVGYFLKFTAQDCPLLLVMDGHRSHLDPELVR